MAEERGHRLRNGLLVAAAAILVIVVALVLVLAVSSSTGSVDTSAAGPFYEAPDPLPEGEPGTVIRSEPMAIPAAVKAPAGATSRRFLYLTTDPQTGERRWVEGELPPG